MPVLRTERLVLRPLTADLARTVLDGGTLVAAPGFPRAEDVGLLERVTGFGDPAPHVYLVEHDGALIGTLGVSGPVDGAGRQEIGYGLVPAARGRGLATEAVAALCAVLERSGVGAVCAQVELGNLPSLRLLERLGFREVPDGASGHQLLVRDPAGRAPVRLRGRHVC